MIDDQENKWRDYGQDQALECPQRDLQTLPLFWIYIGETFSFMAGLIILFHLGFYKEETQYKI